MLTHKNNFGFWLTFLLLSVALVACKPATINPDQAAHNLRVLSWNIGEDAFVKSMPAFHSLVAHNRPDILLLDEVEPASDESLLRKALPGPANAPGGTWHIDYGASGGRQRGVIVSRFPLENVPEFDTILAYPKQDYDCIAASMSKRERNYQNWTLHDGIAANAAIVLTGEYRLLVVTLDLQCCGNDPGSWQEYRRRVEVREIRKLIKTVLMRTEVDGIIVAGDFNVVSTPLPLLILSNLDNDRYSNLSMAEVYQSDGSSWTWDGRGTMFPSRAMDFQLYSAASLRMKSGFIFNSELFSPVEPEQLQPEQLELEQRQLEQRQLEHLQLEHFQFGGGTSKQLSDHLPVIVDYQWK